MNYELQIEHLLESSRTQLSNIKPSEWNEKHRVMTGDVSAIRGPLRYKNSPYTREIIDCLHPGHPARIVAVMKGAQIGFSTTVIEGGIGWIIAEKPAPTLFMVGHDELVEAAVEKVDKMIDSTGLRKFIRPNVQRARNMKTGDTNRKKDFPGGWLMAMSANHKMLRQFSVQYGFIDDYEAMKGDTKQSGSTFSLVEQRFASYKNSMKLFLISTPELKQTSNIEPAYLAGDQRKYHIPCPCCGDLIPLEWSIPKDNGETAGITWKMDEHGKVMPGSVGYICQQCGGFFNDRNKAELLQMGVWKPTAEPSQEGYYSYHLSSLYAPTYMFDWAHYVNKYLQAHPPGTQRDENLYKTFVNLCLGMPYEEAGTDLKANELQRNQRNYEPGIIPEKLSERDGNGKIVMLTCACDLNGTEEDARLDYEVVAHAESGSTYSVLHGSIGTFVPRENTMKIKADRERWTYAYAARNSVWPVLNELIGSQWHTDTGRKMRILMTGVDVGYQENHAWEFISKTNWTVIGLKGDPPDKLRRETDDKKTFRPSRERPGLYLVSSNHVKDQLAACIKLRWDEHNDAQQPDFFLNFPSSANGLYLYNNYFSHFEAEHRIIDAGKGSRWVKKTSVVQNHLFDCRCYNIVVRDILVHLTGVEYKIKNPEWADYVAIIKPMIK